MNDDPFEGLSEEELAMVRAEPQPDFAARVRELATPTFSDVADWLLAEADARKYPITPDPNRKPEQLGIDWCIRAILINPGREPSPTVVWDLIHEIGHIPKGKAPDNQTKEQKMKWEREAWEEGWKMAIAKFPWLKEHHKSFWDWAEEKINTYEKWDPSMAKKCGA